MGSSAVRDRPGHLLQHQYSSGVQGVRILSIDLQQQKATDGSDPDRPLHRSLQLLRAIPDKRGLSPAQMHNMHFQDDRGLVNFIALRVVIVQVAANVRLRVVDPIDL